MLKRVLLAYDGSAPSRNAAEHAAELARRFEAEVTVLTVGEMYEAGYGAVAPVRDRETCEAIAAEGAKLVRREGSPAETRLVWGSPVDEIVEASRGFDLLVMGHRGRGGVLSALLGSVARYVIDHAACSVLVVR